jgi:hypothetical protein
MIPLKHETMKKSGKSKIIGLLLVPVFISLAGMAQRGINIQILVDPGLTMGGKYEVPKDPLSEDPGWETMKKSVSFGLNAGLAIGYNFSDALGVSLGLQYAKQGQHYKDYQWTIQNESATWSRKVNLNYLRIPLQLNYILKPENKISYYISAGVYVGILLGYNDENKLSASDGSEMTATAKGDNYTQTYNGDSQSAIFIDGKPYKSVDFGGLISAGLQVNLSEKISIPIGIIYHYGFLDVKNKSCQFKQNNSSDTYLFWQNGANNSPNATDSYHNSLLALRLGIRINL